MQSIAQDVIGKIALVSAGSNGSENYLSLEF
jgi:hypothetical protein